MDSSQQALSQQVVELKQELRRTQTVGLLVGLGTAMLALSAFVGQAPTSDIVRTRQLVIEDSAGRDRIVLGAPMRDNFQRMSPSTGMAIRDSAGNERFGLGLNQRGDIGMGFDAPPCTRQPCNPERINITASNTGGAQIRFLDRETGVAARMELAPDDRVYLRFMKVTDDSIRTRSLSLLGDTATAVARQP
jgi:hypothetical protein